ncbi:MAG TPA: ATP-binding cassette domain-containing protein [Vicinamibacteria bacterium]|nr:ATP-binding cassette domain-containing protein [Vicinamibacteria bacterium]
MTPPSDDLAVRVRGVDHHYGRAGNAKQVLFGIDLEIGPGQIVIMTGPSGSGKTTLLTLIGALRMVQKGEVSVLGHPLAGIDGKGLGEFRRRLGFIFQMHNLFDSLTALQNVRLALELHDLSAAEVHSRSTAMLEAVGLGERIHYKPEALSGGQRQRVAVARGLVTRPKVVLADEPTAALDGTSGREVVKLLQRLAREEGTTTLLVTHDNRILDVADRIVNMVDGRIVSNVLVNESIAICEFLSHTGLFAGQTPASLANIAEKMVVEKRAAGEVIFRQGDAGDKFYLIRSGVVEIDLDGAGQRQVVLLEEGKFFGELALMEDRPRRGTALAREASALYSLTKEHFLSAVAGSKSFRDQLLDVFSARG